MTNENIIKQLKRLIPSLQYADDVNAVKGAIKALSQEPCDDAISREAVIQTLNKMDRYTATELTLCDTDKKFPANEVFIVDDVYEQIAEHLPSVTQKSGKCKNCKYFEYDSVAKVDGIPLIVAHEICNKWGNGCKTSEDGYCYLFEPQEGANE